MGKDERKSLEAQQAREANPKCDVCGHTWEEHAATGCTHEGCDCVEGVALEGTP